MSGFKRLLGFLWASPVTVAGVVYAGLFNLLGWHKWLGVRGDALVWLVDFDKSPLWLRRAWRGWGGHTIGNVVVLSNPPENNPTTLIHEQKHVDQFLRLGIFQPIIYVINLIAIKLGCPGSDPYYSNPFEIDARRHAGQLIDVEGSVKKITERNKTK